MAGVVAILGGSGGIGKGLIAALAVNESITRIEATHNRSDAPVWSSDVLAPEQQQKIHWTQVNASDESALSAWIDSMATIDWMINCVGVLHTESLLPEKSIRQFDSQLFELSMQINCLPTLLLAKYAGPKLRKSPQGVFATVSARVGSIEDNRLGGWHSYRASKAAVNMAIKCIAIEWERTHPNIRVLSLHPGTTDTELSKPFQKRVPESQLFSIEKTAQYLLTQLETAHEHPSGRFIAWDGSSIPW